MRWNKAYLDKIIGDSVLRGTIRVAASSDRAATLMRRAIYRRLASTQGPPIEIQQDADVLTLRHVRQTIGRTLSPQTQI